MASVYKFSDMKNVQRFFKTGSLRLGTVYDYKDTAKHGIYQGDAIEGINSVIRRNEGTLIIDKNSNEPIISEIGKMTGEGTCTFVGGTFCVERASPDLFLFCTSKKYSEDMFTRWDSEVKKDRPFATMNACFEIFNPEAFANEISNEIKNYSYLKHMGEINYAPNREVDYMLHDEINGPAFTKEKEKYSWQEEYRMAWATKKPGIKITPRIINAPRARQYCRLFASLEAGSFKYHR